MEQNVTPEERRMINNITDKEVRHWAFTLFRDMERLYRACLKLEQDLVRLQRLEQV